MSNLEARLTALADTAFPPTPNLQWSWQAKAVRTPGFATRGRRGGALALVGVLVLAGGATVAAVELTGPEDVLITRIAELPPLPGPSPLDLGPKADSLAEASALAGFTVRAHARPQEIHVDRDGIVTLVYDDVVVTQTEGILLEKVVGPDTDVRVLRVAGTRAVFFTGGNPRIYDYARPRLTSAPTLVVQSRRLLVRIEGASLERARTIATDLLRSPAP